MTRDKNSNRNYEWARIDSVNSKLSKELENETELDFPPFTFFAASISQIRPTDGDSCVTIGIPVGVNVAKRICFDTSRLPFAGSEGTASTFIEQSTRLMESHIQENYSASGFDPQEGLEDYDSITGNVSYQKPGSYEILDRNTFEFTHGEDADFRGYLTVETPDAKKTVLAVGGVYPDEDDFGQLTNRMQFDVSKLQSTLIDYMSETRV
ncbi:hypothetical protein [Haloarcula pellucida]|nr:hypothetical protein [Halomicroarcula pellucida]MBX0348573.1 hypothetical protein [Halomicroarcula pellucida]